MRKVRLFLFLAILRTVATDPTLVLDGSELKDCCPEYDAHCSDTCAAGGSSMVSTSCYGMSCTEYCFCSDNSIHEHPGGTYCPACNR